MENMSFKDIFILKPGGNFVNWNRTVCAIMLKSNTMKYFCEIILNFDHRFRRRRHLKIFIFLAQTAILISLVKLLFLILVEGIMWVFLLNYLNLDK